YSASPGAGRRIYLKLVAVYTAVHILRFTFTSELYPRVHTGFILKIQRQDEVTKSFFSCQERVGFTGYRCPHNFTVLNFKLCFSIQQLPAFEILSIKEITLLRKAVRTCNDY